MESIDQWVIHHAVDDYKKLHRDSLLFISINISINELDAIKTAETIFAVIQDQTILAQNLVVELTENMVGPYSETLTKTFISLSKAGVQIAIDYYGVSNDSLKALKQLPISLLKIDESLISSMDNEHYDKLIFNSTMQLAHALGLKVVAKGVETRQQLASLKENVCDYAQGYYFSKALDIDQLVIYLSRLEA